MSKLEELISKLCPKGVPQVELQEILVIRNGADYKSFSQGPYPVYGSGGIMTSVDRFSYDKPSVLIPRKGSLGNLFFVDEPFWNVDTIFYTEIDDAKVYPKYVFYTLQSIHLEQYNTAGGVPSLTQKILNKIKIPVPPLPVQREIVRILDTFTAMNTNLEEELAARRKQYAEHSHSIFGSPNWSIVPMGEVLTMKAGKSIQSSNIAPIKNDIQSVPCYGGNGIRGYVVEPSHHGSYSIIGRQGALCGNIQYVSGDFYATEHAVVVSHDNRYNSRFLYHLLMHMNLNQYKTQGAQPGLSVKRLESVNILLPPLNRQEKIARVLDSMYELINSAVSMELALRRKQYEYYRDKLLAFKEA